MIGVRHRRGGQRAALQISAPCAEGFQDVESGHVLLGEHNDEVRALRCPPSGVERHAGRGDDLRQNADLTPQFSALSLTRRERRMRESRAS